jgi:phenylacetate-CoA ligase
VVRKSELLELQKARRPFGGLAAVKWGHGLRPRFRLAGPDLRAGRRAQGLLALARAFYAAGFRVATWCTTRFSYHFTPAGSMTEDGRHALGCTVFPAGVGQTEQQVAAMLDLLPTPMPARRPSCASFSTRPMSWA